MMNKAQKLIYVPFQAQNYKMFVWRKYKKNFRNVFGFVLLFSNVEFVCS